MVVFDSAVLTLLLWDRARPPVDPETNKPVDQCKERMEFLVSRLHKDRDTIVIPTPVLSEVLVVVGSDGLEYVFALQKTAVFRIEPFDTRAAIELAEINRSAMKSGHKKSGISAPWARIKLDRQIVAIAKVAGAHTIYTDDLDLGTFAKMAGLHVIGVRELDLPPENRQADLMKLLESEAASMSGQEDDGTDEELEPGESPEEDEAGEQRG